VFFWGPMCPQGVLVQIWRTDLSSSFVIVVSLRFPLINLQLTFVALAQAPSSLPDISYKH
jgi:hypothetical protein